MGYALKLSNVDFSSVAVERVTFVEAIPCTNITLSQNAITVDKAEDTVQLTATVTPSDTTDHVVWRSSNENVATVSNGVVTVHGIGTATITATCGTHSATATVTQTTIKAQYDYKTISGMYPSAVNAGDGGGQILGMTTDANAYIGGQAYHNVDALRVRGNNGEIECVRVPYGATTMKFATQDGTDKTIGMVYIVDTTTMRTDSGVLYPQYSTRPTNVKASVGMSVAYGQAFMFRGQQTAIEAVSYIYFV